MKLDEFKSKVASSGLARSNRWLVSLNPPKGLSATNKAISNTLSKNGLKLGAKIPLLSALDNVSRGIEKGLGSLGIDVEVPTLGYLLTNMNGLIRDINLYASSCSIPDRAVEAKDWEVWGETRTLGTRHQHGTFNVNYYLSEDLKERRFFEQWQDVIFNPANKKRSYYDEYVSSIEVHKFDNNWNRTAVYRMYECYPISITDLGLDNEQQGNPMIQGVTFQYRYFERIE